MLSKTVTLDLENNMNFVSCAFKASLRSVSAPCRALKENYRFITANCEKSA